MIDQGVYGYGSVALDFPREPVDKGAYSTGSVALDFPREPVDQGVYGYGDVTGGAPEPVDQGVYGTGTVALDFPREPVDQAGYIAGNVTLDVRVAGIGAQALIKGAQGRIAGIGAQALVVLPGARIAGIGTQALIKGYQARIGGIGAQAIIIDEDDVPDPEAQDTFVIAKPLVVGGKIKQPGDTLTKEQIKTINRFRRYVARGYIVYGGEDGYYATRHMEFRGESIKPGDKLDLSDLLYPNPFQRPHRSVLAGDAPDPGDDDD